MRPIAHAPGLACHFHPHFDCPEDVELNERDFEAHPRDVIPDEFAPRGAFWWYAPTKIQYMYIYIYIYIYIFILDFDI